MAVPGSQGTPARSFLIGSGIIYAVLWLYGTVIDHESSANFVPVNAADNWLNLGLAVGISRWVGCWDAPVMRLIFRRGISCPQWRTPHWGFGFPHWWNLLCNR